MIQGDALVHNPGNILGGDPGQFLHEIVDHDVISLVVYILCRVVPAVGQRFGYIRVFSALLKCCVCYESILS